MRSLSIYLNSVKYTYTQIIHLGEFQKDCCVCVFGCMCISVSSCAVWHHSVLGILHFFNFTFFIHISNYVCRASWSCRCLLLFCFLFSIPSKNLFCVLSVYLLSKQAAGQRQLRQHLRPINSSDSKNVLIRQ